jgi:hypothetical protein
MMPLIVERAERSATLSLPTLERKALGMDQNKKLKRLREMAGLSQYELSGLSGIPRNRLSLAECGYVTLRDEEYGLAEHVLREVLIERQQHVRTALSSGRMPQQLDPKAGQAVKQ